MIELFTQTPGKALNTISLFVITISLFAGALLHIINTKRGKNREMHLKIAAGWVCWAVAYIIITIRLGMTIDASSRHILLYQIILTLDAFGFACFFFFIADGFEKFTGNNGFYSKKLFNRIGWGLFALQVPFIWFAGGFGTMDTPFGVEILPSFVCQNIMAIAMIAGGVLYLLSAGRFKQAQADSAARTCRILGAFMIVLILHIFTTVIMGHTIVSGLVLLGARVFLGSCPIYTAKLSGN